MFDNFSIIIFDVKEAVYWMGPHPDRMFRDLLKRGQHCFRGIRMVIYIYIDRFDAMEYANC